jgi:hypothetical protein
MKMLFPAWLMPGADRNPPARGLAFSGETEVDDIRLLVDETWVDAAGRRHVKQEIFEAVFSMIDEAETFILLDFFLLNDFEYEPGAGMRPLSRELAERLVAKRRSNPAVEIVFITDPVNTVYGSIRSPHFTAMEQAGVRVVWTELNRLRDSNCLYSPFWRLFGCLIGTGPGRVFKNPLGEGRISARSMFKLLNFKANHRKVVLTDQALLVTSANPHSGSSAHWNMALRVDGAGKALARQSESAILQLSGAGDVEPPHFRDAQGTGLGAAQSGRARSPHPSGHVLFFRPGYDPGIHCRSATRLQCPGDS